MVIAELLRTPLLRGWMALVGAAIAVGIPTSLRAAVDGVVTGCEFTPYLPFVLASAILLGWRLSVLVTLVSVALMGGLIITPANGVSATYTTTTHIAFRAYSQHDLDAAFALGFE